MNPHLVRTVAIEHRAVGRSVVDERFVTIVGPSGIGKTTKRSPSRTPYCLLSTTPSALLISRPCRMRTTCRNGCFVPTSDILWNGDYFPSFSPFVYRPTKTGARFWTKARAASL